MASIYLPLVNAIQTMPKTSLLHPLPNRFVKSVALVSTLPWRVGHLQMYNSKIGALTKPDTVQPGEHLKWKKILEGYKHELQHGYL